MNEAERQLEALLGGIGAEVPQFPPNSRYHAIPLARMTVPDGREIVYLRRRFIPPPEEFSTLQEHRVVQGDRLDTLAATYLGDPEAFWRLCDANGALRPEELLDVPGHRLRITLPAGIKGPTDA
jgi:hypothetical protein